MATSAIGLVAFAGLLAWCRPGADLPTRCSFRLGGSVGRHRLALVVPQPDEAGHLFDLLELLVRGRAAVPPDGAVRGDERRVARAVRRRGILARPSQGRHRDGGDRRLRRLRRDLRLVARDSRDHGPDRAARTQAPRLFRRARDRHARRRRHDRHPHAAVWILIIYAILTEQNIAKLFVAAIIPGMLAAVGYCITIAHRGAARSRRAPARPIRASPTRALQAAGPHLAGAADLRRW